MGGVTAISVSDSSSDSSVVTSLLATPLIIFRRKGARNTDA